MAKMKESFLIYTKFKGPLSRLSAQSQGYIFMELMNYVETGEHKELPSMDAEMAFLFIKNQIDIDQKKYDKKIESRSEAGKLGGAPEGNSNAKKQTKQPKTSKTNKTTKNKHNDNDNVNVNGNGDVVVDNAPGVPTTTPEQYKFYHKKGDTDIECKIALDSVWNRSDSDLQWCAANWDGIDQAAAIYVIAARKYGWTYAKAVGGGLQMECRSERMANKGDKGGTA